MVKFTSLYDYILTIVLVDFTGKATGSNPIDPVQKPRVMHDLHNPAIWTGYFKRLGCKVRPLKKDNIGKMPLIKHEIPKLKYILVHPLDCITCRHKVLVFILALKNARKNLFNIIPLML